MKTYVALFRGINVGGHNLLRMQELVVLLENLDLHNVTTYLQSGNAVFQSVVSDAPRLSARISSEIEKSHGFAPQVLLLGVEELAHVIASNPFPEAEADPKTLHVLFLASVPTEPDLDKLESLKTDSERFCLQDKSFYLFAPDGVGRSKLAANAERLLGVPATGRNWRTVREVMALAVARASESDNQGFPVVGADNGG